MNNKQKQIRYILFAVLNVSFILITFYAFFGMLAFLSYGNKTCYIYIPLPGELKLSSLKWAILFMILVEFSMIHHFDKYLNTLRQFNKFNSIWIYRLYSQESLPRNCAFSISWLLKSFKRLYVWKKELINNKTMFFLHASRLIICFTRVKAIKSSRVGFFCVVLSFLFSSNIKFPF